MNLNATQLNKLSMLEGRAKLLIPQHESKLVPVVNLVKRRSCVIVHQCLSNTTCTNFNMYFKRVDHAQGTRSNKVNVVLPKVRLSCARNGFYYMGAKVFNELPTIIKAEKCLRKFKSHVINIFLNFVFFVNFIIIDVVIFYIQIC